MSLHHVIAPWLWQQGVTIAAEGRMVLAGKVPAAAGGDDLGQRNVPLLLRHRVHLLAVVGESQRFGAEPMFMPAGEGAIVIAAAHAEPVALGIERHQRGADKVERAVRHHLLHVELRFGDAVTVAGHGAGGGVAQEEQMARGEGVQHRQVDLFLLGPQPVDGGQGVELAVVGQIEGDAFGRQDLGMLLELGNQLLGRLLLLGLG